jgi:hypothetical protein
VVSIPLLNLAANYIECFVHIGGSADEKAKELNMLGHGG